MINCKILIYPKDIDVDETYAGFHSYRVEEVEVFMYVCL